MGANGNNSFVDPAFQPASWAYSIPSNGGAISEAYYPGNLRVDGTISGGVFSYIDIFADIANTHIPPSVNAFQLEGYYTPGDNGRSVYKRSVGPADSGKVQSADGAWWIITNNPLTPEMFGAQGVGDESALMNDLTWCAGNIGSAVSCNLSGRTYTMKNVYINRGYPCDFYAAKGVKFKLPNGSADGNVIMYVTADNCKVIGGEWDGNAANQTVGHLNTNISCYTADGGDPTLSNVEIAGGYHHDTTYMGIFGIAMKHCTIHDNVVINTAGNGIMIGSGSAAFPSDTVGCEVFNNYVDRSAQSSAAIQGCIKISSFGASPTAIGYCSIHDNVCIMPEQATQTNGNVAIEMNGIGNNNSIVNNQTYGAYIGVSLSGMYDSCANDNVVRAAGAIGVEVTKCTDCAAVGNVIDGLSSSGSYLLSNGINVDFQSTAYTTYRVAVNANKISGIKSKGIFVIATAPAVADTYKGADVNVVGNTITTAATGAVAPVGIYFQSVEDCSAGENWFDGWNVANGKMFVIDGCRRMSLTNNRFRQLATQFVSIVAEGVGVANTTDQIDINGVTSLDTTGQTWTFSTVGAGLFGTNMSFRNSNMGFGSLTQVSCAAIHPTNPPLFEQGYRNGTPAGVVTAAVGSRCINTAGGAATTTYVKESGTGNTGWVGK